MTDGGGWADFGSAGFEPPATPSAVYEQSPPVGRSVSGRGATPRAGKRFGRKKKHHDDDGAASMVSGTSGVSGVSGFSTLSRKVGRKALKSMFKGSSGPSSTPTRQSRPQHMQNSDPFSSLAANSGGFGDESFSPQNSPRSNKFTFLRESGGDNRKNRDTMKRNWDHSRRLAAMAGTPGADGRRPRPQAAPYSPYVGDGRAAHGKSPSYSPGRAPRTPPTPVHLQPAPQRRSTPSTDAGFAAAAGRSPATNSGTRGTPLGQSPASWQANWSDAPKAAASPGRRGSGPVDLDDDPFEDEKPTISARRQRGGPVDLDDESLFEADFGANFDSNSGVYGTDIGGGPPWEEREQQQLRQAQAEREQNRAMKNPHMHAMASPKTPQRQHPAPSSLRADPFHPDNMVRILRSTRSVVSGVSPSMHSGVSPSVYSGGSVGTPSREMSAGTPPRGQESMVSSDASGFTSAAATAAAIEARRKMRQSMQQARQTTGRSHAVLGSSGRDVSGGSIVSSSEYQNALMDGSPSFSRGVVAQGPGRPPFSPPLSRTRSSGSVVSEFSMFDAYGTAVDDDVNSAIGSLIGSHPDLGVFLDREGSSSRSSLGQGSITSRSRTASVSYSSSAEESSIYQQPRVNQFKEKAVAEKFATMGISNTSSGPSWKKDGSSEDGLPIEPLSGGGYGSRDPAQRLRKEIASRKQHASSVSDVGGPTARDQSEVHAVVGRLNRTGMSAVGGVNHSAYGATSQEAMSDVGAPPNNLYSTSKLKKTGIRSKLVIGDARKQEAFVGQGGYGSHNGYLNQSNPGAGTGDAPLLSPRAVAMRERLEMELRDQGQVEKQRATESDEFRYIREPRKVAYRERREMELETERASALEMEEEKAEVDVAALLRKREREKPQNDRNANPVSRGDDNKHETGERVQSNRTPEVSVADLMAQRSKASSAVPYASPKVSVADLMGQRSKVASPTPPDDSPQASIADLMGQRAKIASPLSEESISNDGKDNLSALLASRSAKVQGKTPAVTAASSIANMMRMRSAKNAAGGEAASAEKSALSSNPAEGDAGIASDDRPALKKDPKYSKYFTMLKVGMPMGAVKNAMARDGLDSDVMDGDHTKPVSQGPALKDDPKYAKYFKMLKMGLPMDAVKHSIEKDGLDASVMDGDHNAPVPTEGGKKKKRIFKKDTHRRTRLHWGALDKVKANSVWGLLGKDPDMESLDIDEEEFKSLFQEEINDKEVKISGKGGGSKKDAVKVIDAKRANNGGIILARLKMSYEDMATAVDAIDDSAVDAEQAEGILEYLPTKEERKSLKKYMTKGKGDAVTRFEALCECEKFMVAMMTVAHSKRKIKSLIFKSQFRACLRDLAKDAVVIEQACEELKNSVRFRKLLGYVLNLGNRLNTAGSSKKSKARGVSLESLLKLSQAKAFDKKTTFLDYVVLVVQRNNPDLLNFKEDLPHVMKADKVHWDQCLTDLEEVENQLENVRKIALYEARKSIKGKVKWDKDGGDDDDSIGEINISLEEEVKALRSSKVGAFTLDAIKKVSALRDKVEWTNKRFSRLLEYLGEEGKTKQPHVLFKILVTFCKDFESAISDVEKKQKVKKRSERKEKETEVEKGSNVRGGAPRIGTRPESKVGRNPLKNASPLDKARMANPPELANLLDEIERKKASGQDRFRQSAPHRPSPPKQTTYREQENMSHQPVQHQSSSPQRSQTIGRPSYIGPRPASQPVKSEVVSRTPGVQVSAPFSESSRHLPPSNTIDASNALPHNFYQASQPRLPKAYGRPSDYGPRLKGQSVNSGKPNNQPGSRLPSGPIEARESSSFGRPTNTVRTASSRQSEIRDKVRQRRQRDFQGPKESVVGPLDKDPGIGWPRGPAVEPLDKDAGIDWPFPA